MVADIPGNMLMSSGGSKRDLASNVRVIGSADAATSEIIAGKLLPGIVDKLTRICTVSERCARLTRVSLLASPVLEH